MTKEVTKNKGGRLKRVLTKEEIEQVGELAGRHTIAQIAYYLGICETSFHAIKNRQSEVSEAYKKGRLKSIDEMASLLMQKARDGDVTSIIFFLKTQGGWSDKMNLEQAVNNKPVPPTINIHFNKKRNAN